MDLKQLLEPMDYKMRAWPWGNQLAYIDARQAQDKLDEVCWPENWKVEYKDIRWGLFAWVSINVWEEWITKWDGGTESNIEKEKGLISDSFKRACVCWGIGRFLYSLGATKATASTKPDYPDNSHLKWIAQKNIDNLKGLLAKWEQFSLKDIRAKYKISNDSKAKLKEIGIQ